MGLGCCGRGHSAEFDLKRTWLSDSSLSTFDTNSSGGSEHQGSTKGQSAVWRAEQKLADLEREFASIVDLGLPTIGITTIDITTIHHHTYTSQETRRSSLTNASSTYHSYEPTPLTQVLPRLYLGSQEDAEQGETMLNLGVTHIISIVGGGRYSDLYHKHMYIPLRDNGSSDLLAELERSYDFMVESQKPDNKLFIHCQLGQNRSASFVIGFLMRYNQWCLHKAYTFLKEKRKLIHPHTKYIKQLREFDLKLNQVYSTPENFLLISVCPQGNVNIQHEDFCSVMSSAYKKRQSDMDGEDGSPSKKPDSPGSNKKHRRACTNPIVLTNIPELDVIHRSFTISRTIALATDV